MTTKREPQYAVACLPGQHFFKAGDATCRCGMHAVTSPIRYTQAQEVARDWLKSDCEQTLRREREALGRVIADVKENITATESSLAAKKCTEREWLTGYLEALQLVLARLRQEGVEGSMSEMQFYPLANNGWRCPGCGRYHAPYLPTCPYCPADAQTVSRDTTGGLCPDCHCDRSLPPSTACRQGSHYGSYTAEAR